ncbi:MAG: hypothetical protein ACLSA2_05405 [Candidatus Gastranaerophilaceae bacterium]|nr:unknown [Clostridium sp. CAG:967]
MKIVNFETIKEKVNKLDAMAQTDLTKINTVFPQNNNGKSVSERMQIFFSIADGDMSFKV